MNRLAAGAALAAASLALTMPLGAQQRASAVRGAATATTIRPADLRARLEAFAHDSMEGREAGTPGHDRGVEYLARQLRQLGLQPAGENGTFFQSVPLIRHELDRSVRLSVDGAPLRPVDDYAPIDVRAPMKSVNGAEVVFGGPVGGAAELQPAQVAGKFVVFTHEPGKPLLPPLGPASNLFGAAGVGVVFDSAYAPIAPLIVRASAGFTFNDTASARPVRMLLTARAAERMLGRPLAGAQPGAAGRRLGGDVRYVRSQTPTRNVVAVLPGRDARLRGQYVALGAHSDHDGLRWGALGHDSLRALLVALRRRTGPEGEPPPVAEQERIAREVARGVGRSRPDSIFNGADDDGSGSIGLVELAEYFAAPANRPRRSLLFVWHTAEEKGLHGARWYTDHPTVPLDSIVAQVNIDMIGRGSRDDLPNAGPDYVQILGSRRLSTQLGDLVEAANAARARPFRFDYQYDAPGHPQQYYCRSDHAMYARHGIPVVFLSTGDHVDYHQLTDEVQYIDFDHFASVVELIRDVAKRTGDVDQRPALNGPKPDPTAQCQQ